MNAKKNTASDIKSGIDREGMSPTLFTLDLLNAMGSRKAVQLLNPQLTITWEHPNAVEGGSLGACEMHIRALRQKSGHLVPTLVTIEARNEQTLYNRAFAHIRGQVLEFGSLYFDELLESEDDCEEDEEGENGQVADAGEPASPHHFAALPHKVKGQIPGEVITHVMRRAAFYQGYDREALLGRLIQVEAELNALKA